MVQQILKRDGRKSLYDRKKIADAIYKAAVSLDGNNYETATELSYKVDDKINKLYNEKMPTVENIQDVVEKVLIDNGHAQTAKQYILYRAERTRSREMNTTLMKTYEDLTFKSSLDNNIKRENANINGDTAMGTMLKYGSEGAKQFYEMFILDKNHADAHANGDIHIHDLDFYTLTTTCCQIDLKKLFTDGFSTGNGFLREPNDIRTYAALACIAIQSNQNDQHGGQSIPNFDYNLSDGVRKTYKKTYINNIKKSFSLLSTSEDYDSAIDDIYNDIFESTGLQPSLTENKDFSQVEREKLSKYLKNEYLDMVVNFAKNTTDKEVDKLTYQAMEALVHNLNTMHSRAGAQIPFSSINYGTDTSKEGRLVTKNILLATESGLGHGETPIFPIHIFKVKEGINYNENDPNYDLFKLAMKVSAKRLFPNFSFIDSPFNLQYYKEGDPNTEIAYMGCRTRVIGNVVDTDREIVTGRGNLSFTSINLPRLAILSGKDEDKFLELLNEKLEICIKQLLHRYKIQCAKTVRNSPFLMGEGVWIDSEKLSMDDKIERVIKHGSLSVGFIGLAEALISLTGKHHGESEYSQALGLKTVKMMRDRLDEEAKKRKLNFTLLATPAEGLSGRFIRMDREKFGELDRITNKEYYTNSFHVPVNFEINAFDKINIEAPYHEMTNAGHITYVELDGDVTENLEAFEKVVRHMKDAGIGYGAINHPIDRDPVCGYNGIINDVCPGCGREETEASPFERIRRITGYLVGTLDRFNNAKKAEEADRVKHGVNNKFEAF